MMSRRVNSENPDRLYTVTGGRSRADHSTMDMVTLVVSECDPAPGMQSEHARILQMCARPMAVVEISSELSLPISVVRILLGDLLDSGRITARRPPPIPARAQLPDPEILKQVLVGLQKL
ncbi:DUF742 domain-containing protein [Streptosporangium subroseum]|uniref:DUF742 domain-containing protein n=1 Tax=Streptosporangium subroseum TaxID=106412 RepID=UPI00342A21DA